MSLTHGALLLLVGCAAQVEHTELSCEAQRVECVESRATAASQAACEAPYWGCVAERAERARCDDGTHPIAANICKGAGHEPTPAFMCNAQPDPECEEVVVPARGVRVFCCGRWVQ